MNLILKKQAFNYKYYSTTVNLFENFKPEILMPLKECHIKIFMNITTSTHQDVVDFIQSNLIDLIKSNHNDEKLFVKLHILAGKQSKLILSETDRTYVKEDIDSLNKILSRRNYSSKEGTKSRNRDLLMLMYDLRGMAATVKRLSYAIQKNNINPNSYSVIYTAAFNHLLRNGNASYFQSVQVSTSIIKSSFKIGPRESNKYFFGFSEDEIQARTPKLKSTSKKTNAILSENEANFPKS
jgi:hypothetical protein